MSHGVRFGFLGFAGSVISMAIPQVNVRV